jgi:hypothetical protein
MSSGFVALEGYSQRYDLFTSHLREVQKQAQDTIRKIELPTKIPTFDDLAAQDDYIHSEEFNVRGQPREYSKMKQKQQQNDEETTGTNNNNNNDDRSSSMGMTAMSRLDEDGGYDSFSTTGSTSSNASWSLLDRPGSVISDQTTISTATKLENDDDDNNKNNKQPKEAEADVTTTNKTPTKSNITLLSIVTDTLQDTPPTVKLINTESNVISSSRIIPGVRKTSTVRSQSVSSDHSFDDDDEEDDPILSLLKKESSNHTQQNDNSIDTNIQQIYNDDDDDDTTTKITTKSTNRFIEDLDKRLETPEESMEAGRIPNSANDERPPKPIPYFTRGPFGGAVLNMAARNFNRILKIPESSSQQPSIPPPLARGRPRKLVPTNRPEEDFHVASSTTILRQDDLAELQQLKTKSILSGVSPSTMLLGSMQENRHFLFIGFTMLLAVFVYFWSQKRLEDDVTR